MPNNETKKAEDPQKAEERVIKALDTLTTAVMKYANKPVVGLPAKEAIAMTNVITGVALATVAARRGDWDGAAKHILDMSNSALNVASGGTLVLAEMAYDAWAAIMNAAGREDVPTFKDWSYMVGKGAGDILGDQVYRFLHPGEFWHSYPNEFDYQPNDAGAPPGGAPPSDIQVGGASGDGNQTSGSPSTGDAADGEGGMTGDSDGAGYSVEGSTPESSYTQASLNYSGFDAGSSFDQGTQLSLDSGVVAVIPVVQLAGDDSGFDAGIFLAQLAGNDSGVDPGHAPGDTDSGASFDPGAHAQDMNQSPGDGVNVNDQVSHGGDPSHNPGLGTDHSGADGYHSDFASPNESDQVA